MEWPAGSDWGAEHWKPLLVAVVVGAIAIMIIGPDHVELQGAGSAAEFRATLEHPGRQLVAALIDVEFALAYGVLGVGLLCRLGGRSTLAAVGAVTIAIGALADVIENLFLVVNIARHETVTDGWITAMRVPGTIKWVAAFGFVVLFALLGREGLRRRRATA